jgi:hypothetical protein
MMEGATAAAHSSQAAKVSAHRKRKSAAGDSEAKSAESDSRSNRYQKREKQNKEQEEEQRKQEATRQLAAGKATSKKRAQAEQVVSLGAASTAGAEVSGQKANDPAAAAHGFEAATATQPLADPQALNTVLAQAIEQAFRTHVPAMIQAAMTQASGQQGPHHHQLEQHHEQQQRRGHHRPDSPMQHMLQREHSRSPPREWLSQLTSSDDPGVDLDTSHYRRSSPFSQQGGFQAYGGYGAPAGYGGYGSHAPYGGHYGYGGHHGSAVYHGPSHGHGSSAGYGSPSLGGAGYGSAEMQQLGRFHAAGHQPMDTSSGHTNFRAAPRSPMPGYPLGMPGPLRQLNPFDFLPLAQPHNAQAAQRR